MGALRKLLVTIHEEMGRLFVVYEDPHSSEVAKSFESFQAALRWLARPTAHALARSEVQA